MVDSSTSILTIYIFVFLFFVCFFFLSLSNNYLKKKIWLVIKSGAWHTACDSLSLTGCTHYPA